MRRSLALLRAASTLALLLASGCDSAAQYCVGPTDLTVDRFVMCEKSCLKGNEASCKEQRTLERRLCHEKLSFYHCTRACSDGDQLACARAKAAAR